MPDNILILGLDTSGTECRVALYRNERVLYQQTVPAPNLHSTLLTGLVGSGLEQLNLEPAAVQLVCITSGPGSFTGLRIGMAYAKGFCFALGKPLQAVTNFEVLAWQSLEQEQMKPPLYVLIDARRESCYLGVFKQNPLVLDACKLVKTSELGGEIAGYGRVIWAAENNGREFRLPPEIKRRAMRVRIEPAEICRSGYRKYSNGEKTGLDLMEPLYIQSFAGVL
jgi:tRNA threonylcarbamoyladenosine biosynthesis protein TsaB